MEEDLPDGVTGLVPTALVRNSNAIDGSKPKESGSNNGAVSVQRMAQQKVRPLGFTISEAAYAKNLGFAALQKSDPALYMEKRMRLSQQRAQICRELAILDFFPAAGKKYDVKGMRELSRHLWVLDGVLLHGISRELLEQIVQKYAEIDAVPNHYFQPELYQATLNLKK